MTSRTLCATATTAFWRPRRRATRWNWGMEGGVRFLTAAQATSPMIPRSQTVPRLTGPLSRLPALCWLLGHRPAQEARCPALGKRLMSGPISARMALAATAFDPWDGLQQLQGRLERRQAALDLSLHLRDGLLQELDVPEDLPDQHQMVRLDPATQRLPQLRQLSPQGPTRQVGQHLGVLLATQQG